MGNPFTGTCTTGNFIRLRHLLVWHYPGYQLLQESCILIFDKTDPVTLDLRTTALSKHNRLLAHEAQPKVAYKMLVFLIFSSPGFS